MRSTPIGLAMLNDERPHVYEKNNPENMAVLKSWAPEGYLQRRKPKAESPTASQGGATAESASDSSRAEGRKPSGIRAVSASKQ